MVCELIFLFFKVTGHCHAYCHLFCIGPEILWNDLSKYFSLTFPPILKSVSFFTSCRESEGIGCCNGVSIVHEEGGDDGDLDGNVNDNHCHDVINCIKLWWRHKLRWCYQLVMGGRWCRFEWRLLLVMAISVVMMKSVVMMMSMIMIIDINCSMGAIMMKIMLLQ